jgi:hypothetical protein
MGGSALLKEMYREYLIAGSVTTVGFPVRQKLPYSSPEDAERPPSSESPSSRSRSACCRPRTSGRWATTSSATPPLGYLPDDEETRKWLREFFDPQTTAARKAPCAARTRSPPRCSSRRSRSRTPNLIGKTMKVYRLNPRMAFRTSMPKGAEDHARPLLTRDFALLEAKRLLNIMDYALLQGGSNYIVVAKKGTDERPALPEEVANLTDVVRRAARPASWSATTA